ncbi:uncharacterized protein [Typha latifolia]|uniref:uncharacterized protein n=1 Tax=Typha latifolia TaxID=4733 RepID=UPI003C2E29E1
MRIRRRPPFPSSLTSDPSTPLLPPPNGARDDSNEREIGVGGRREGLLHPDGRGLGEGSTKRDQTIVGKRSSTHLIPSCRSPPPPNPIHAQGVEEQKQKQKKKKEEEEMVDSTRRWDAGQVNSNKRLEVSDSKKKLGTYDHNGLEKERKSKKSCTSSNNSDAKLPNGVTVDDDINQGRKRKRSHAAALMEGSRCSRVNGRGWRCCQQTLVGYSLCEHHLGKGRLRSMTSVRGQLGSNNLRRRVPQEEEEEELMLQPQYSEVLEGVKEEGEEEEDNDEEKMAKARRKSIGMVKARSISSLLDEMNDNSGSSTALQSPVLPPSTLNGSEAMV